MLQPRLNWIVIPVESRLVRNSERHHKPNSRWGSCSPSGVRGRRGAARIIDEFVSVDESQRRYSEDLKIIREGGMSSPQVRHRSLPHKDALVSRPVQRTGTISSHVIVGGLHHHHVRV